MAAIPAALAVRAGARHGIITDDDLADAGISIRQRRRMVEAGRLVRMHNGVYRLASQPANLPTRCGAACAARPELVIDRLSAGRLWSFRRLPPIRSSELVTAVVPARAGVKLAGVDIRRSRHLPDRDVVHRPDGLRVTSPVRTVLDLAALLDDEQFESVVEQLLDGRTCTAATFRRLAAGWCRRGRPGSARVRRLLDGRPPSAAPVGSDLELRVLRALAAVGVPLVRQFEVELPSGRRVRIDAADPLVKWGLEIDHHVWHASRSASARDKDRDRQLHLLGWQIERVSDDALAERFDHVIAELVMLHRNANRAKT